MGHGARRVRRDAESAAVGQRQERAFVTTRYRHRDCCAVPVFVRANACCEAAGMTDRGRGALVVRRDSCFRRKHILILKNGFRKGKRCARRQWRQSGALSASIETSRGASGASAPIEIADESPSQRVQRGSAALAGYRGSAPARRRPSQSSYGSVTHAPWTKSPGARHGLARRRAPTDTL